MIIDPNDKLMEAWVRLLKGNITVPVFDEGVPDDTKGNYVLLRIESETEQPIGSRYWTKPIVITDIVTEFGTIVNPKTARAINSEIKGLLVDKDNNNKLNGLPDIQIDNVYVLNSLVINERTPSKYYYRIVTRYRHDIIQVKT